MQLAPLTRLSPPCPIHTTHTHPLALSRAPSPERFTLASGVVDSVDFTCSLEQMQDLLAVVRDATKQVDRMLSSADQDA